MFMCSSITVKGQRLITGERDGRRWQHYWFRAVSVERQWQHQGSSHSSVGESGQCRDAWRPGANIAGVLVFLRDRQKTLKFLRIVESAIVEKVSPVLEAGLMAGQSMCPWWHRSWHSSRPGCPGNLRQDKVRGVGEGKSSQPYLRFGETTVNQGELRFLQSSNIRHLVIRSAIAGVEECTRDAADHHSHQQ